MKLYDVLIKNTRNYIVLLVLLSALTFFFIRFMKRPVEPDDKISWTVRYLPYLQFQDTEGKVVQTVDSLASPRTPNLLPTLLYYFNPNKTDQRQAALQLLDSLKGSRMVRLWLIATRGQDELPDFQQQLPPSSPHQVSVVYDFKQSRDKAFAIRKNLPFLVVYGEEKRIRGIDHLPVTQVRLDTLLKVMPLPVVKQ
ncbi:MAG: hypothetical protein P0Y53_09900 [Candidatus Pseudobacter hemicellulosilyticus]|uniref:Uncharacterized protein n=1 Tax=Candidatus Pseudobacter hemicellulosilyticus TaxID=3121375 RepID=A0AAJ5WX37_9BACT|nr:MAG: hypothetical protein P0Y53_09900 [Pseudobacter sp.]